MLSMWWAWSPSSSRTEASGSRSPRTSTSRFSQSAVWVPLVSSTGQLIRASSSTDRSVGDHATEIEDPGPAICASERRDDEPSVGDERRDDAEGEIEHRVGGLARPPGVEGRREDHQRELDDLGLIITSMAEDPSTLWLWSGARPGVGRRWCPGGLEIRMGREQSLRERGKTRRPVSRGRHGSCRPAQPDDRGSPPLTRGGPLSHDWCFLPSTTLGCLACGPWRCRSDHWRASRHSSRAARL